MPTPTVPESRPEEDYDDILEWTEEEEEEFLRIVREKEIEKKDENEDF
jgi:hypothetical protein